MEKFKKKKNPQIKLLYMAISIFRQYLLSFFLQLGNIFFLGNIYLFSFIGGTTCKKKQAHK
jgi:uncharacterized membrane protein YwzB